MRNIVFDASALLALLYKEKGAEVVLLHLDSAVISSVNFTEVATRMIHKGEPIAEVVPRLDVMGVEVVDHTKSLALLAAEIYPDTKPHGLSLGDRACLALAMTHKLPVLTADRTWKSLKLGVKIEVIR